MKTTLTEYFYAVVYSTLKTYEENVIIQCKISQRLLHQNQVTTLTLSSRSQGNTHPYHALAFTPMLQHLCIKESCLPHGVDHINLAHGAGNSCRVAQQPCIMPLGSTCHVSSVLSAHLCTDCNNRHKPTTCPNLPDDSSHRITHRQ